MVVTLPNNNYNNGPTGDGNLKSVAYKRPGYQVLLKRYECVRLIVSKFLVCLIPDTQQLFGAPLSKLL